MRQAHVTRSVAAVSAVFVVACAAFAWLVEYPPDTQAEVPAHGPVAPAADTPPAVRVDGAERFATRCRRCHSVEEAGAPLRGARDPARARAALIAFLVRHRKSQAHENEAIVDYLQEAVRRSE